MQWLYSSPALHVAMAPRFVPGGTSRAGTSDPGSKGCASHTFEVIRSRGSAGCQGRAIGCAGKRMRVIAAPLDEGSGPWEIEASSAFVSRGQAAICASLRRVTAGSGSFLKSTQGLSSVVTVSAASSDDARRRSGAGAMPALEGAGQWAISSPIRLPHAMSQPLAEASRRRLSGGRASRSTTCICQGRSGFSSARPASNLQGR